MTQLHPKPISMTARCCAVLLMLSQPLSAETRRTIEDKNDFGGRTEEVVYEKGDTNFEFLDASRIFYDGKGKMVRSVNHLNEEYARQNGFDFQQEDYTDGVVTSHKMYFNDAGKAQTGRDYLIEFVDGSDKTIMQTHGFGELRFTERMTDFSVKYPFYCLSYLNSAIYEKFKQELQGTSKRPDVSYSAKYNEGRAVLEFLDDPVVLDKMDQFIVSAYFQTTAQQGGEKVYTRKVRARESQTEYTLYLQDSLVPYVKKGDVSLVSFVVIGCNQKLYPMATSLLDKASQ